MGHITLVGQCASGVCCCWPCQRWWQGGVTVASLTFGVVLLAICKSKITRFGDRMACICLGSQKCCLFQVKSVLSPAVSNGLQQLSGVPTGCQQAVITAVGQIVQPMALLIPPNCPSFGRTAVSNVRCCHDSWDCPRAVCLVVGGLLPRLPT